MNLFDETENKYYELVAYLLDCKREFSRSELNKIIDDMLTGEPDFEVTEALFEAEEGEELIFQEKDGFIKPILESHFPIRHSEIEKQALRSIVSSDYCHHFLDSSTIEKVKNCVQGIEETWDPKDITIKNLFSDGDKVAQSYLEELKLIAKAIMEQRAISYDNIRPGRIEINGKKTFPVKIEYSVVNDKFRIIAYEPQEYRFIKMNLSALKNVQICDEVLQINLQKEYQEFLKANTKHVILDVDPIGHVIERCFRVFSYYDRKARFDKADNKYRLEVSYLKADENEVIKNILSMGSSVVVIEPRTIQKEVYRRIKAASMVYEE